MRSFTSLAAALTLCACIDARAQSAPPPAGHFVERVTGGASASDRLPLVVALHGLGDTPENFIGFIAMLPVRARVAAARGLIPWHAGFAWIPPEIPRNIDDRAPALRHAVTVLEPSIRAFAHDRPTCGLPIVVGFSQGAMVAYALAASEHAVVAAAFPLSGLLPPALWPHARPIGGLLPSVHAEHGGDDPVVPIAGDRASIAAMRSVGFDATMVEYPHVGHTITDAMRDDVLAAIGRAIRAQGCSS